MKSHYSAKELVALPGLPGTERAVQIRAEREAWPHQKRAGRGGGKEYPVATLPIVTQRHLNKLAGVKNLPTVKTPATVPAAIAPLPAIKELTGHQNQIMNARVFLVKAIEADMALGHRLQQSLKYVVEQITENVQPYVGQANFANDRKRKDGVLLSERSLMRFWCDWKNSGRNPVALAPNDGDVKRIQKETALVAFVRDFGTRADKGELPATVPAWMPYFLAAYRKPQKPSLTDAIRSMGRTMPHDIEMPTYGQIRHTVNKIPAVYIEKGRSTGAEIKAIMGFNRRVWNEYHPFTVGQVDGHSFKAYVAHPVTGAHFHPEVCAIIDMTTKLLAGYSAGLAESSRTVGDAYRHACRLGIFGCIEADLGAGNKATVNSDHNIGLFARMGTALEFPEVAGNPQGHGGIERSNQSIWIRAAKELPTYTGKDMDRSVRKKIYTRLEKDLKGVKKAGELAKVEKTSALLLTWRQFLAALEIWVAEYNNTPHRALPKITDENGRRRNRTPNEELAHRISEGWDPKSVQVEGDMQGYLFMPRQEIKVDRCEFRMHGNRYHSYSLQTHHGETMIAAYDIHDANNVYVLNADEQLVCTAIWNGNNIHGRPMSKVETDSENRADRQVKLKSQQIEMIEASRRQVPVIEPLTPEQTAIQERMKIEFKAKEDTNVRNLEVESSRSRYKRMKALRAVLADDGLISEEEYKNLMLYERSAEFKALKGMEEEHGKAFK